SQGAELGINYFEPLDPTRPRARSSFVNIKSIRELEELARIVDGRWFQPRDDGIVEVVVDENSLEELQLLVGDEFVYEYAPRGGEKTKIIVKVVGVFEPLEATRST